MPTKPLLPADLVARYEALQRQRENEAIAMPFTRRTHGAWLRAQRRMRAADRHMMRVRSLSAA